MSATSVSAVRPRWGKRRRWGLVCAIVAAVMVGSGVAGALTVRHLDRQYGPVHAGLFSGPYSGPRLASAPGASGRLLTSLGNSGLP
jgi:hypothetical protein